MLPLPAPAVAHTTRRPGAPGYPPGSAPTHDNDNDNDNDSDNDNDELTLGTLANGLSLASSMGHPESQSP